MKTSHDRPIAKMERWLRQPPRLTPAAARCQILLRTSQLPQPTPRAEWRRVSLAIAFSLTVLLLTTRTPPPPETTDVPTTTVVVFELATGTDLFLVLPSS